MGQEIEGFGDEIAYFDGVAVRYRKATSADRKLLARGLGTACSGPAAARAAVDRWRPDRS